MLDRLGPVLPLSRGRAERHGFEYAGRRLSPHDQAIDRSWSIIPGSESISLRSTLRSERSRVVVCQYACLNSAIEAALKADTLIYSILYADRGHYALGENGRKILVRMSKTRLQPFRTVI
jgi:hypothetical protein